jgi:hypothetical protein
VVALTLGSRCEEAIDCAHRPVRNGLLYPDLPSAENGGPARRRKENEPLLQGFPVFDLNDGKATEPPYRLLDTVRAPQGHVQKNHDFRWHIDGKVLEDFNQCPIAARR